MHHVDFIHRCLALAEGGRGEVGTNPLVGAVLVRDGQILAEAFHREFGKAHAERALLDSFEQKISPEDVLYVNLEPCCHHGKTPPCTDIICERGVRHLVFGMVDPDPLVRGKGIEVLRKAGVEVIGPVERSRCEWLNRGFVSLRAGGRPWITLKQSKTRSGTIAKPDGSPLKITSEEQDRWAHAWLRARHDAILVGAGTILSDDPELTVRFGLPLPSPIRVILDPHLRIPLTARVVNDDLAPETIVIAASNSDDKKRQELRGRGGKVFEVLLTEHGFDLPLLWRVLTESDGDFHGIASLLIEGGARTWKFFREAGCVDEEVTLIGAQASVRNGASDGTRGRRTRPARTRR